jgi:hypothetical protein
VIRKDKDQNYVPTELLKYWGWKTMRLLEDPAIYLVLRFLLQKNATASVLKHEPQKQIPYFCSY